MAVPMMSTALITALMPAGFTFKNGREGINAGSLPTAIYYLFLKTGGDMCGICPFSDSDSVHFGAQ